jgi:hypothetical protein
MQMMMIMIDDDYDDDGDDGDDNDDDYDFIFLPIYRFYWPLFHHVLLNITVSSYCSYYLRVLD